MPYGENPGSTNHGGARWGITFQGRNDGADYGTDTGKSASIYGVSEDTLGYNRKVGLSFYTSPFDANQEERLRIRSDGQIDVKYGVINLGTADSSSGHMNAYENMSFNIDTDNDDTNRYFTWHINGSSASGTELMEITEGGNIGIGTDNPSVKLHVHDGSVRSTNTAKNNFTELGSDGNIEIKRNGSAYIDFSDDTTEDYDVRIQENSNGLRFITGGQGSASERVRITSDGKIGIGSASPVTDVDISQKTGAVALPQGTTAQRPSGSSPYIRYNTTNSALEFYNGTDWVEIITDYFPTGSTIFG